VGGCVGGGCVGGWGGGGGGGGPRVCPCVYGVSKSKTSATAARVALF